MSYFPTVILDRRFCRRILKFDTRHSMNQSYFHYKFQENRSKTVAVTGSSFSRQYNGFAVIMICNLLKTLTFINMYLCDHLRKLSLIWASEFQSDKHFFMNSMIIQAFKVFLKVTVFLTVVIIPLRNFTQ